MEKTNEHIDQQTRKVLHDDGIDATMYAWLAAKNDGAGARVKSPDETESTDKETELTEFKRYIRAELELIGCKYINITTFPNGTLEYSIRSNRDPAIQIDFIRDGSRYVVILTRHTAEEWYNRMTVKVELTRIFNDKEKIPLSALSVQDTLTVIKQSEEGTVMRLTHKVYDSYTCTKLCDTNTVAELVTHIFEISKL